MAEKRRSVRIDKPLVAMYSPDNFFGERSWDLTVIHDISDEGMKIVVNNPLGVDEKISFRLKIPFEPFDWKDIKVKVLACEKARVSLRDNEANAYSIRVRFVKLTEEEQELIKQYVEWYHFSKGFEEREKK